MVKSETKGGAWELGRGVVVDWYEVLCSLLDFSKRHGLEVWIWLAAGLQARDEMWDSGALGGGRYLQRSFGVLQCWFGGWRDPEMPCNRCSYRAQGPNWHPNSGDGPGLPGYWPLAPQGSYIHTGVVWAELR